MATQSTQWLIGNRSRIRMALLLGAMVLALAGGMVVSRAGQPQAAHAAASVVQDNNIVWAGNIAIGDGYQWASAEWTVPLITDNSEAGANNPCWAYDPIRKTYGWVPECTVSMWVGLGGADSVSTNDPGNLIQAGTDSYVDVDSGRQLYRTWWEDTGYKLPGQEPTYHVIDGTICSNGLRGFTTSAHDHMRVYVSSNYGSESAGTAYFRMENLTTGCTINFGTYALGSTTDLLPPSRTGTTASTAEWILELPGNHAGNPAGHIHPNVDSAVFTAAKTGRNGTSLFVGQTSHNYTVITQGGSDTAPILAEPGWISCDGTSFRVYLGASPETGCSGGGGGGGGGNTSANLAQNGGFNNGNFNSWTLMPGSNWAVYSAGQIGNNPYEGSGFASTNTSQAGGGIGQTIPMAVNAGDSFCASARVVTQGASGGAGGMLALFLLNNNQEVASQSFSNLPGGNGWTLEQTCVTATRAHTNLLVEFYPNVNDPKTLSIDAVGVYRNLVRNGGFNNGNFNSWTLMPGSNWAVYSAGQIGNNPYEGSGFASTNTSQAGGGIGQTIPLTISTGQTFCASAQVVTQGTASGAGGMLALFLLNNNQEVASQSFSNLPAGNNWTLEQTCITATRPHTNLLVEFYPNVNDPKTLSIDAVGVHYN